MHPILSNVKKLKSIITSPQGSVIVEFAFILPIMLLLTFPVIDYSRYILMQQKLTKAASFMADAVAMSRPIEQATTQSDIDTDGTFLEETTLQDIVNTINIHMMPFAEEQAGGPDRYQAILTHVYKDANGIPALGWQFDQNSQRLNGAPAESTVGVLSGPGDIGSPATMPPELQNLQDGENLVVAEVFANYEPITPDMSSIGVNFLSAQRLTYRAFFRARYGNLRCIWQVYMPPNGC